MYSKNIPYGESGSKITVYIYPYAVYKYQMKSAGNIEIKKPAGKCRPFME